MPAKLPKQQVPIIRNALLRCIRRDDKTAPLFERIEEVPGLWVLELGPSRNQTWSSWLQKVRRVLTRHKTTLKSLRAGSKDYTLHVSLTTASGLLLVVFPPSLSKILAEMDINLELLYYPE